MSERKVSLRTEHLRVKRELLEKYGISVGNELDHAQLKDLRESRRILSEGPWAEKTRTFSVSLTPAQLGGIAALFRRCQHNGWSEIKVSNLLEATAVRDLFSQLTELTLDPEDR